MPPGPWHLIVLPLKSQSIWRLSLRGLPFILISYFFPCSTRFHAHPSQHGKFRKYICLQLHQTVLYCWCVSSSNWSFNNWGWVCEQGETTFTSTDCHAMQTALLLHCIHNTHCQGMLYRETVKGKKEDFRCHSPREEDWFQPDSCPGRPEGTV